MIRFRLVAVFVCALLGSVSVWAAGDDVTDWGAFHGPDRDNISREKGLLQTWPTLGPRLVWTAENCGVGYSTVTIAGDSIYTAGKFGKDTFVLALDMNGKLRWKVRNGQAWEADPRHRWAIGKAGSRATPTIDDGIAYHLNETGRLAAFSVRDGKELWSMDFSETFQSKRPMWGYAESVLIDGEKLLCYPGGPKGYMVALDKKTGKVIWANTKIGDQSSYCSGVLVDVEGVRQVITMTAAAAIGVRVSDGALLWRVPFTSRRGINVTTPIYHEGHVFASSGYGTGSTLIKLTRDGEGFKAERVWTTKSLDNHHGGVVKLGEYLYGSGHQSKGWACLDFKTGKETYRGEAGGKGSLLYADGLLYCWDEQGTMELVRPTPDQRPVVSSFRVPEGGKGLCWAHPVIHGGRLYLRHANRLFAYDIRAK